MTVGELGVKIPIFRWDIDVSQFENRNVGYYLKSPEFSTYGRLSNKWNLWLYPKGSKEGSCKGYLSLYLNNICSQERTVSYSFSILNQKNVKVNGSIVVKNHIIKSGSGHGFEKFIEESYIMDPLNNVLRNNKLTILCNVILIDNDIENETEAQNKKNSSRLSDLDSFEKLLTNNNFSDVTIVANKKKYHLHKCILSLRSTVFDAMLRNDMREKNQNTVEIEDIRAEVLDELFLFMYTGKCNKIGEVVCELLMAAEKYCVEALKLLCEETMSSNLNIDNCVYYLKLALLSNTEKLKKNAMWWISSHLECLIENPEFNEFGKQHPEMLIEIMKTPFSL